MSNEDKGAAGGGQEDSGGASDDSENSKEIEALKKSKDRILSEKKKLQADIDAKNAKLAEYEEQERLKEQKLLEQKGEYEKALELEKKRAKEHEEKYNSLNAKLLEGKKLNAFLEALNGSVDQKFWGLIDLAHVSVNQEGDIDKDSLNKAVATFTESYGNELIRKPGNKNLPPDAPRDSENTGKKISYDDWKKLPPSEMKKRIKDVV